MRKIYTIRNPKEQQNHLWANKLIDDEVKLFFKKPSRSVLPIPAKRREGFSGRLRAGRVGSLFRKKPLQQN